MFIKASIFRRKWIFISETGETAFHYFISLGKWNVRMHLKRFPTCMKRQPMTMKRMCLFSHELSPEAIEWIQDHYKLYKGRSYVQLQHQGPGWTFPKCHESLLRQKCALLKMKKKTNTVSDFSKKTPRCLRIQKKLLPCPFPEPL